MAVNQGTSMRGNEEVWFVKLKPTLFRGQHDADTADDRWTMQMDKIFKTLRCNDTDKVTLAVFKLEEEAEYWSRMVKRKWDRRTTRKTWDDFLEEFNTKFIPEWVKDKRKAEFMDPLQE
ncbi:hypothetical protein POM88_050106 [Heracleum sosnowskyi]|uniref:Retrotransposon gag domain-containing protein n=1 Tax=Heracleum sosnowskyi TaxID=360622 RepID=A0AAD8M029_9APIA|nr:hypothetical protein POM88_050106 [Heracleum sosnowskyi]